MRETLERGLLSAASTFLLTAQLKTLKVEVVECELPTRSLKPSSLNLVYYWRLQFSKSICPHYETLKTVDERANRLQRHWRQKYLKRVGLTAGLCGKSCGSPSLPTAPFSMPGSAHPLRCLMSSLARVSAPDEICHCSFSELLDSGKI